MSDVLTTDKFLIDDEYRHFLAVLDRFQEKDHRNVTMLKIMLHTGVRCCEFLRMRHIDVLPRTKSIQFYAGKGGRDRELPLPAPLFAALMKYVIPGSTDPVFNIKYNRLRAIWLEYRPVKKKIHSLRHTFAIRLYERYKDVQLVQRAMGHRSVSNTMIYQERHYGLKDFQKIIF